MPLRYVVTKVSGQGEQITAEIAQCHPVTGNIMHNESELTRLFQQALSVSETRMMEMNVRMLEAYELSKYFEPMIWQRVLAILDILAGRQTANMVAARWQSEHEETADLEQGRLAALQMIYNGAANDNEGL